MAEPPNLDDLGEPRPRPRPAGSAGAARERSATYDPPDDVMGREGAHLLDYVNVFYKRRWTAVTAFLVVMVSGAAYTFTATPIFEARTRLLIEADEQHVVSFKQVVEEDQAKADYYQTQYNVLRSRTLARRTLDGLKLWDTKPFGGAADEGFSLQRAVSGAAAALGSAFARPFSSRAAGGAGERERASADETTAQSRAINVFLANLSVAPVRNSRLVDITYRLPDAALATGIANALAKNYIRQNLEYKLVASKEASDWLGERLTEQRKAVEAAEAKLQLYREQNDAISFEDRQNIVVQKLADLNAAVTRAKTERIQKEAAYRQLLTSNANPALLDTFPAILTNTFIQQQKSELAEVQRQHAQLSEKLGDKHPDIIRLKTAIQISQTKLNGEIAKIVQSVKSEYEAALAQENSLAAALGQQKSEALAMNRKAIDYGILERDMQSSTQLYQSLLQRAKETGVSGELRTNNVRIVDVAEKPLTPVTPRKGLNLAVALLAGLLFSCGLILFFEYMDNRIKTPDEVGVHLGLSQLGLLPEMPEKLFAGRYPLLNRAGPSNFTEAFLSIRTNILFSSAEERARSVVVTSTGPAEGKTVVAGNLAVSLAQAGQRVLFIDADMRRPKAHEIFGLSQQPGLSNLLVGNAKPSDAAHATDVPGLWVMPAGRIPPNPAELVGSSRFSELLSAVEARFDWVIVDSPPVMAVTDAALIAHQASGVVFVVGADMTSRHAARCAIERLEHVNARFFGAVLNRVDIARNAYYYSAYFRKEYTQYYVASNNG